MVVTLALGIGANTAMFSVVNTILLQPLPYKDSGRLVSLWTTSKNGQRSSTAFPDFREIREQNRTFDSVAAYTRRLVSVRGTQYPQRFRALVVSPEFLSTLDVQPRLGRDFRTEEGEYGSNNRVVIITDSMWRSSFGSDPQIIGRNIILDAQPYTIVGVLPPDVWFLDFTDQLMLPLSVPPALDNRANHYLNMIGRLRPGVSREIAAHDLTRIATTTGEIYSLNKGTEFQLALLQQEVTRNVRNAVLVLMAAADLSFSLHAATWPACSWPDVSFARRKLQCAWHWARSPAISSVNS
jgi:putative ABC transport system permease protein